MRMDDDVAAVSKDMVQVVRGLVRVVLRARMGWKWLRSVMIRHLFVYPTTKKTMRT